MHHETRNVLRGKIKIGSGTAIQAAANYLRNCQRANPQDRSAKNLRSQEAERLKVYATQNNLWVDLRNSEYLSEGAEQKVYFLNSTKIIKANDGIFYTSWLDYFSSLLLHNHFFSDTTYELVGFSEKDNTLCCVVKQPFVEETEATDLTAVKDFLADNGFVNIKNSDYRNDELGLILEDLHNENVLTKGECLYFIDTIFYVINSKILFRGGHSLQETEIDNDGISLTKVRRRAASWAGYYVGGKVFEYTLSPEAKILSDIPKELLPKERPNNQDRERILNYAKVNGYDGVDLSLIFNEHEIRMFNTKYLTELDSKNTDTRLHLGGDM